MGNVNCPSCKGTGRVTHEEAIAIYEAREDPKPGTKRLRVGDTCWCDGPAHSFDPAWCGNGRAAT